MLVVVTVVVVVVAVAVVVVVVAVVDVVVAAVAVVEQQQQRRPPRQSYGHDAARPRPPLRPGICWALLRWERPQWQRACPRSRVYPPQLGPWGRTAMCPAHNS